jgi:hypothetical protein
MSNEGGATGSSSGSTGSSGSTSTGSTSSSGSSTSSSSSGASSSSGSSSGTVGTGIFANCSIADGCIADCSAPANDPIASTDPGQYDIYDGCILAGLAAGGFTETWQAELLKGEAVEEGGAIVSSVDTNTSDCGGQNCGMIAISAGAASGDAPPGPCGVDMTDPFTTTTDYSHSYGLFQDTPACEGTFLMPSLPAGYTCTGTTTNDLIPFTATQRTFYCETATSQGVTDLSGNTVTGYINGITDPTDPYYKLSVFNPAYNLFVHLGHSLPIEFQQANAKTTGCTKYQQLYNTLAYWLVGNPITSCTLSGSGLKYVQAAIGNYQQIYGKAWPYPAP